MLGQGVQSWVLGLSPAELTENPTSQHQVMGATAGTGSPP